MISFSLSYARRVAILACLGVSQLANAQSRIDVPLMFDSGGRYVLPVSMVNSYISEETSFDV